MSERDPKALRRELLLDQAIHRQLDDLVRMANSAAALLAQSAMEKNQLRNLVNVAVESRSVAVVVNFIRYQIARNSRAWGSGPNDFGHHVIDDVRTAISESAGKVVADIRKALAPDEQLTAAETDELKAMAHVRLVQLYLGYLNRAFYYGKETKNFQQLKELANGR